MSTKDGEDKIDEDDVEDVTIMNSPSKESKARTIGNAKATAKIIRGFFNAQLSII